MKKIIISISILYTATIVLNANAQKLSGGQISKFEEPYQSIIILKNHKSYEFGIDESTSFTNKKKKKIEIDQFLKGCIVTVYFKEEGNGKMAKSIRLTSNEYAGIDNFSGAYEVLEDSIAFIDGLKVQINSNTTLKCSGKDICGCSDKIFRSFADFSHGDFVEVRGERKPSGVTVAQELIICNNQITPLDYELKSSVEKSFFADTVQIQNIPANIPVPPTGLYEGKIRIGDLEYKLLDSIRIQGYINSVGYRILPDYAKKEEYQKKHSLNFRFYVIDHEIPNAFAYPNGMIFIHTGLLKLMNNEAQLAAVLGHEIAHVLYEHARQRYEDRTMFAKIPLQGIKDIIGSIIDNMNIKVLGSKIKKDNVITKSIDKSLDVFLEKLTPQNLSNLFAKPQETQADRASLMYMYMSGYDPREAANLWQLMAKKTLSPDFKTMLGVNTLVFFKDNKLSFKQSIENNITSMAELATKAYLETIYTSHPLAQNRRDAINYILLTNYSQDDFTDYFVGTDEYESFIECLKVDQK